MSNKSIYSVSIPPGQPYGCKRLITVFANSEAEAITEALNSTGVYGYFANRGCGYSSWSAEIVEGPTWNPECGQMSPPPGAYYVTLLLNGKYRETIRLSDRPTIETPNTCAQP